MFEKKIATRNFKRLAIQMTTKVENVLTMKWEIYRRESNATI